MLTHAPHPRRTFALAALTMAALALAPACSKSSSDGGSGASSDKPSPQEVCAKVLGDKTEALDRCVEGLAKVQKETPALYDCQVACAMEVSDPKAMGKCAKKCSKPSSSSGSASLTAREKRADRVTSGTLGKALTEKKDYKFVKSTSVAGGKAYHYVAGAKSQKPEVFVITLTPIQNHDAGKQLVDGLTAGKASNTVGYAGDKQAVIVACTAQGNPPGPCHSSMYLHSILKAVF